MQSHDGAGPMIIGAVMGGTSVDGALQDALGMVGQAQQALARRTILAAGTVVAGLQAPWNDSVPIATEKALSAVSWGGQQARISVRPRPLRAPVAQGAEVGTLTATLGTATFTTPLVTSVALDAPPWSWRLLRRPPYVPPGDWPG